MSVIQLKETVLNNSLFRLTVKQQSLDRAYLGQGALKTLCPDAFWHPSATTGNAALDPLDPLLFSTATYTSCVWV